MQRNHTSGRGRSRRRIITAAAVAVAALVGAACTVDPPNNSGGGDLPTGEGEPTTPEGDDTVRLNELQFIGSHNSYRQAPHPSLMAWINVAAEAIPEIRSTMGDPRQWEYDHPPIPTQLDRGLRTFEFDVFADPEGGKFATPMAPELLNLGLPRPIDMDEPGIKVLHIQDIDYRSTCTTLVKCLTELKQFSDAQPDHLPIVINIELKDGALPAPFDATAITPFDAEQIDVVDTEIRSVLGDRLITPDDVRGDAVDLRTAITTVGWPTIAESRGKFLFFMDNANKRDVYLQGHPSLEGRVMFTSSAEGQPDGAVIKENDPADGTRLRSLVEAGYLVRTRADADVVSPSTAERDIALASGAQIVHTDFPQGSSQVGTGYVVTFGTRVAARCNPVLTTDATCTPAAAVETR